MSGLKKLILVLPITVKSLCKVEFSETFNVPSAAILTRLIVPITSKSPCIIEFSETFNVELIITSERFAVLLTVNSLSNI